MFFVFACSCVSPKRVTTTQAERGNERELMGDETIKTEEDDRCIMKGATIMIAIWGSLFIMMVILFIRLIIKEKHKNCDSADHLRY